MARKFLGASGPITYAGSAGLGKVLTSDATGAATWQSPGFANYFAGTQSILAATATYVSGSAIQRPVNGWFVGTTLRWKISGSTTSAAGTATNTINLRVGTAGNVTDAVHMTYTTMVGTANSGIAFQIIIDHTITSIGATAGGGGFATIHNGASATGLVNVPNNIMGGVQTASFNSTSATPLYIGVSLTLGASKTVNLTTCYAEILNP